MNIIEIFGKNIFGRFFQKICMYPNKNYITPLGALDKGLSGILLRLFKKIGRYILISLSG